MSNTSNTIRAKQRNAKKGNFYAALELYRYYDVGQYVDQDPRKANHYLEMAYDIFKDQSIKLDKININNFRLFDEVYIDGFDDHLNIFIGNNGAGKTSLLDAIALSLSWLKICISKNGGSGDYIESNDINFYSDLPYASVLSSVKFNKKLSASLSLSHAKDGRVKVKNALSEFKAVGDFYKTANDFDPDFNIPLLAYYDVMRSYDVDPKDLKGLDKLLESNTTDKFDVYQNSLTGKTDFKAFIKWYKKIDDILNRRQADKNRELKLSEVGISEDTLELLKSLSEKDESAKKSYEEIQAVLPQNEGIESESFDVLERNKRIINEVISIFMDGFANIEVQIEPSLDLVIQKNNRKISVMRLSQGEKVLLALVLDIACRLIRANPSLADPLQGKGIILIDEFDLHLHPQWQKNITKNLKIAFPNCQFFLTTHSPLVISELGHQHVYILDSDDNGQISIVRPSQTYGLTANDILNELMKPYGVEQITRSQSVEDALETIFDLLDEETRESITIAEEKISELENRLHGDIPELVKAKTQLDLIKEWLDDEDNQ